MKKIEYYRAYVSLTENDREVSQDFDTITGGRIVGIGTHIVGTRPEQSVRTTIRENGSDVYDPVDASFTETEGRATFNGSLLETHINNPGRMTAVVTLNSALGNGEDFAVEFLLKVVKDDSQNGNAELYCP